MHGLRPGLLAGIDDPVDQQIAFGRGRRPDQHGVIGHLDMKGVTVGFRIDSYRLDSHAAGSLDHPAGDLTAVCDQNCLEHLVCLSTFGRDPPLQSGTAGADVTIASTANWAAGNRRLELRGALPGPRSDRHQGTVKAAQPE
jgi:hypothetical protein